MKTILFLSFFLALSLCISTSRKKWRYTRTEALEIKKDITAQTDKTKEIFNNLQNLNKTENQKTTNPQKQVEISRKAVSLQEDLIKSLKETLAHIPKNETAIRKDIEKSLNILQKQKKITEKEKGKVEKETKKILKEQKKSKKLAEEVKEKAENLQAKINVQKAADNITEKISHLNNQQSKKQSFRAKQEPNAAQQVSNIMNACTAGLVSVLQGPFCYKRGADFGTIPTGCCCNLERRGALCFERCGGGYYHFGGVCWSHCPGGWTDIGALCSQIRWKKIFWKIRIPYPVIIAKRSYVPKSYTNFHSQSTCDGGRYKMGALCYRNCGNIGYVNCGIGACAADSQACSGAILNMVANVGVAVVNSITLVLSYGSSSGANVALNQAVSKSSKLSQNSLRAANKGVRNTLRHYSQASVRGRFIEYMKNKANEMIKGLLQKIPEQYVKLMCEDVLNSALKKAEDNANSVSNLIKTVDILGVSDVVQECKDLRNTQTPAQKASCARASLNLAGSVAGAFDPIGLLNVAAAFTYQTCNGV